MGELIRYYRTINGYSQKDLANHLHVTVSAVSSWERGNTKPNIDIALKLANSMHITLDEFFTVQLIKENEYYGINDELNLERAYFKVSQFVLDRSTQSLKIQFTVRGLTLYEDFIDDNLRVYVETRNDQLDPTHTLIEEAKSYTLKMSPELEQFPIQAKIYTVTKHYQLKAITGLVFRIQFNGQTVKVKVPQAFMDGIGYGSTINASNKKKFEAILNSDAFTDFLEFYACSRGFDALRVFILNYYQLLTDTKKSD